MASHVYTIIPRKDRDTQSPKNKPAWALTIIFVVMMGVVLIAFLRSHFSFGYTVSHHEIQVERPGFETFAHPTVKVKAGRLRGVYKNTVRVFHGVPFAEPPIGDLRWRKPVAKASWEPKVWNATEKRPVCLQNPNTLYPVTKISEDCLYLEIYAPHKPLRSARRHFPVMVYLHGGAYRYFGPTDSLYNATEFVKRTDVIVVHVAYRLGAMGFLVSGDPGSIDGNYGLHDQAMALKWVHKNIAAFGGDPRRVTLVGQSAGAQSVLIHLLSKKHSSYFRSVIVESPPLPLPVKTFDEGLKQTEFVAKTVGCLHAFSNESFSFDMVCLRNTSTELILKAQKSSKSFGYPNYIDRPEPWGPVIDNFLVHAQPMKSLKEGIGQVTKPILWGVTSEETILFLRYLHPGKSSFLLYLYAKKVLHDMGVDLKRLRHLYPRSSRDSRVDISHMLNDFIFQCPMQWAADLLQHVKGGSSMWTYVFEKSFPIPSSNTLSMCSNRACHGIEIPYVFDTFNAFDTDDNDKSNNNTPPKSKDMDVSRGIMEYYKNFIWYNNPNDDQIARDSDSDDFLLPHWPKAHEDNKEKYTAMVFSKQGVLSTGSGLSKKKCDLWSKLYT